MTNETHFRLHADARDRPIIAVAGRQPHPRDGLSNLGRRRGPERLFGLVPAGLLIVG